MKKILLLLVIVLPVYRLNAQTKPGYPAKTMQGLTNYGKNKRNPYVAAGDRAYLIGTQDGLFPDMGDHIKGEMGGLWCPPFKIADGFWAELQDVSIPGNVWLTSADTFINFPYGNQFNYSTAGNGISVERFQFCPDGEQGVLVRYTIKNRSDKTKLLKFTFDVKSDIRPVWFTDTVDTDYPDKTVSVKNDLYFAAKDSLKPWYLAVASSLPSNGFSSSGDIAIPQPTTGKGVKSMSSYAISVKRQSKVTITFALSAGINSKENAFRNVEYLLGNYDKLLFEKKKRYKDILSRSRITIPDAKLQEVYDWVKINTSWLTRTVPGTGTGLTAGYMEYPWWFGCDNTYALQGVLATGDFKLAKHTLELLYNKSKEVNDNGRIVHEIATSGKVYNKGNTQETAHFIMCLGTYLKWTGDTAFIRKVYPSVKSGLNWLLVTMDKNQNMFPEGYGIMEVSGLNAELIDVAVYTQQALKAAAEMAEILEDKKAAIEYSRMAGVLKNKINTYFWDKENMSYCDFFGSKQQALTTLNGAIKQLKIDGQRETGKNNGEKEKYYETLISNISRMPDTSRGWLTNKNWVINTPMECGIAPDSIAISALNKIKRENCGAYGPYLSATEKKYMMTIATGVQAVAECQYGRIDSAMWYVHKIEATFGRVLPGSISEMMPDYGCFVQAWTNYGIDIPLIQYVFGITPDACHSRIILKPNPPEKWKNIKIEKVSVGDNRLSINRKTIGNKIVYTINQSKPLWKINLYIDDGKNCSLNGRPVVISKNYLTFSGRRNVVTISSGH